MSVNSIFKTTAALTWLLLAGHSATGANIILEAENGNRQSATEVLRQVNGTYAMNWLAWGYDNLGRLTNEASSSR